MLFLTIVAVVTAGGDGPLAWDSAVHDVMVTHRVGWVTAVAIAVTTTGNTASAGVLALVAGALVAGRERWWHGAVAAGAWVVCCALVRLSASLLVARPRPPATDWAWTTTGLSMPSGHTTVSAVVSALFVLAAWRRGRGPWRWRLATVAVLWAAAVALTRVYLGVHWPSDVLAGWCLATAMIAATSTHPVVDGVLRDAAYPQIE